jgi:hypothetical protein
MNNESNTKHAGTGHQTHNDINKYEWPCMQWMESHAAPQGIIHRIGKQMIDVDDHAAHEQQITLPPPLAITNSGNQTRHSKMQKDMEDIVLRGFRTSDEFACLMKPQLPALHLFAVAP